MKPHRHCYAFTEGGHQASAVVESAMADRRFWPVTLNGTAVGLVSAHLASVMNCSEPDRYRWGVIALGAALDARAWIVPPVFDTAREARECYAASDIISLELEGHGIEVSAGFGRSNGESVGDAAGTSESVRRSFSPRTLAGLMQSALRSFQPRRPR